MANKAPLLLGLGFLDDLIFFKSLALNWNHEMRTNHKKWSW